MEIFQQQQIPEGGQYWFLYAGGRLLHLQKIEYESFLRKYNFRFPNISFFEFFSKSIFP